MEIEQSDSTAGRLERTNGRPGTAEIYAPPRVVSPEECDFYHTMDIPGFGHIDGMWDLRDNERTYLGNVDFANKRVLEIGVASGFLSFYMERQGAEVVGYDLSERQSWDIVPYAGYDYDKQVQKWKAGIRRLNNGYWFAHKAFNSKARIVYGTVYEIPEVIGPVDITTFGSVLLHVRDPFLALQKALKLTRETVIVTELVSEAYWIPKIFKRFAAVRKAAERARLPLRIYGKVGQSSMLFQPKYWELEPFATWWHFNPEIIKRFIGVLGFEDTTVTFHSQLWKGQLNPLFAVVGDEPGEVLSEHVEEQRARAMHVAAQPIGGGALAGTPGRQSDTNVPG